jgi:hypothetical protein
MRQKMILNLNVEDVMGSFDDYDMYSEDESIAFDSDDAELEAEESFEDEDEEYASQTGNSTDDDSQEKFDLDSYNSEVDYEFGEE